ncbi:SDR family oxidoreductase, partial [Acinetobacter baumannii]|uniref:SDR family oxidoreductase n=1 Tax=Acinetobacter baumannii TaxID=470 RepID=UPI0011468BCC
AASFAASKAKVVVLDHSREGAEATERMIHDAGGTAISIVADVTDAASIDRAVDRTNEAFGGCDILVN